jgi:hypothetical protein
MRVMSFSLTDDFSMPALVKLNSLKSTSSQDGYAKLSMIFSTDGMGLWNVKRCKVFNICGKIILINVSKALSLFHPVKILQNKTLNITVEDIILLV